MGEAGKEANGDAGGNVRSTKVGDLADSSAPHDERTNNTHNQLKRGNRPMRMETVGGLLVVNIVECVSCIPGNHQTGLIRDKR